MNHNKQCKCNIPIPSFTISPLIRALLSYPPTRIILSLIRIAACSLLPWLKRDWEEARLLVLTSMLRSESIPFGHFAKRCKMSRWIFHRRRPVDDRFPRQRGCGRISLGRRIKGREWWEVTWCRKRRDEGGYYMGAGWWSWEHFVACFSSNSTGYNESCNLFI